MIDVQQNPFEKHRVAVMGECYTEALALEGLPQDCTDELRLPDLPLNQTGRTAFALRNMSDKPYRCALPSIPVKVISAHCLTKPSCKSTRFLQLRPAPLLLHAILPAVSVHLLIF